MPSKKTKVQQGTEFENYVEKLYQSLGFKTEHNVKIGGQQVDIVARRNIQGIGQVTILVDCKYLSSGSVDNQTVHDYAAFLKNRRDVDGFTKGVIVSNRAFSAEAKAAAKGSGILELKRDSELEKDVFDITEAMISGTRAFELEETFNQYIPLNGSSILNGKLKRWTDVEENLLQWSEKANGGIITIFGDFGSGKTTILKRLQYNLQKRYLQSEVQKKIPILFLLRNRYKHSSLDKFISTTLQENYDQVVLPRMFWSKLQLGQFVILLDGYDEISNDVTESKKSEIFIDLLPLLTTKSPAIMSCRPSYFVTKSEISQIMAILQNSSDKLFDYSDGKIMLSNNYVKKYVAQDRRPPEGKVGVIHVHLDTLSVSQMSQYLKKREHDFAFDPDLNAEKVREFLFSVYDLKDLMSRPILLSLTVDTIIDGKIDIKKDTTIIGPTGLYETYTTIQLQRDVANRLERVLTLKQRKYFAQAAALTMLEKRNLSVSYEEIRNLIQHGLSAFPNLPSLPKNVTPDQIALDVLVCAFLTRQDDDSFRFVHKSFMEFFVAQFLKTGISDAFSLHNVSAALRILNRFLSFEVLQFLADYSLLEEDFVEQLEAVSNRIDRDSSSEALCLHNIDVLALFCRERITDHQFIKFTLERAYLKKSLWEKHEFKNCCLNNTVFEAIDAQDVVFRQCHFDGTSFLNSTFNNCEISANFQSSRFVGLKINEGSIASTGLLEINDSDISNWSSNAGGTFEASRSTFKSVSFLQRAKSRISVHDCKISHASLRSTAPFSTRMEIMDAPIFELSSSIIDDTFIFLFRIDMDTYQQLIATSAISTLRGVLFVTPDKKTKLSAESTSTSVQKISESLLFVWQDPETSISTKNQDEILKSSITLKRQEENQHWEEFLGLIAKARRPRSKPRTPKTQKAI